MWKQDPSFCCIQETYLSNKYRHFLRVKSWGKKFFQENKLKKQAGLAILISNKIGFQPKLIKTDREGYFILIKGKVHQDEISILNFYAPNASVPTFITKCFNHTSNPTLIVGDFNTSLSSIGRSSRQKLNRKTIKVTDIMNQTYLTYLQNISPKHKRICFLLNTSWILLQNWAYSQP